MSDDFATETRSKVLEDFIGIETVIDKIIATYYLGKQNHPMFIPFQMTVLRDDSCSFSLKANILNKIITLHHPHDKKALGKQIEQLRRLSNLRNLYAHCGPRFVYKPDAHSRHIITPDPKMPTRPLDFQKIFNEFNDLLHQISNWLHKLLDETPDMAEQAAARFKKALDTSLSADTKG